MFRKFRLPAITLFIAFLAVLLLSASTSATGCVRGHGSDFVQRQGSQLTLHGKPFQFVGTNNYYLMYSSQLMVDDVLNTAAANGFNVMRTWGWLDQTPKNGFVFQTYDGTSMTYNDGATGLANLDYTVAKAGELGIKLVIPFTGNWGDFGGMDQYVTWVGGANHDDFYTNAKAKQLYKAWISHLLNHVNSITGVAYKDDPTIMTWELANEPRCVGSGTYPASANCNTGTITNWASEMSKYIKSIDRKHLVSSGSEGFLCKPNIDEYERDCSSGVDELAISKLPSIDVMSYHLYPDSWTKTADWGTAWIKEHSDLARKIHKPSMLGEFGLRSKVARNVTYKTWTDTVRRTGGSGSLFWILTGIEDSGTLYPDYDGFRITCPSPVCTTLSNAIVALKSPWQFDRLAPVADDLDAVTEFETAVSFDPAASAVAYGRHNAVKGETIDLDPGTAGQQTSLTVSGGTYALQADNTVLFTPATGFNGKATASYTITDRWHRISNAANLKVTVKPKPGVPVKLFSFESGIEGWSYGWDGTGTETLTQSNAWATDGSNSLLIAGLSGDAWFQTSFSDPLPNLSDGYTAITIDVLNATSNWGYVKIALKDANWGWCEGTGQSLQPNANGTFTATMDLLNTSCGSSINLSQVHSLLVYTTTDVYLDNIWAK
jgi:mannan endo-1,4-beta-mannosidase